MIPITSRYQLLLNRSSVVINQTFVNNSFCIFVQTSNGDDLSDEDNSDNMYGKNRSDAPRNSESNGSGDSGDGEEKDLCESQVQVHLECDM